MAPMTAKENVTAVEATTQWVGMVETNSHSVKAKVLEHLDGGRLIGVNTDTFRA